MLIEEKTLNHWIDQFYGYGSWSAGIWFVSYEEDGGDVPEEVAEKLNYFIKAHSHGTESSLCNIREMYHHLTFCDDGLKAARFANLFEFRFGTEALQNSVWKNLIAFAHGYKKETLPDMLHYQRNFFTSFSSSSEALIRLYPLPSPHNHAWYYSWLDLPNINFLKSRTLYQTHVYQKRMHTILQNMKTHQPEVVVMYGMSNINLLKKSIQEFFSTSKFKTSKAVTRQIPQHHFTKLGDTSLVITTQIPTLRHNRIETGFDWHLFGKTVLLEKSNMF